MSEWIKSNALLLLTLALFALGAAAIYGRMDAKLAHLAEAEARIEARQIVIIERLAHLEGRTAATFQED